MQDPCYYHHQSYRRWGSSQPHPEGYEVALHLSSKLMTSLVVASSLSDLLVFSFMSLKTAALELLGFTIVEPVQST